MLGHTGWEIINGSAALTTHCLSQSIKAKVQATDCAKTSAKKYWSQINAEEADALVRNTLEGPGPTSKSRPTSSGPKITFVPALHALKFSAQSQIVRKSSRGNIYQKKEKHQYAHAKVHGSALRTYNMVQGLVDGSALVT